MELDALEKAVLSVVLILVAAWDLKTRRVPNWITWPLLLVAIVVRAWKGSWILLPFLVALVMVELLPQVWRGPALLPSSSPCGGASPTACGRCTYWAEETRGSLWPW